MSSLPHVVIVGAGFGGLAAARALGDAPVRVTVVDRRNHHLFQPLLYQVASAALNPSDIAVPIRAVLRPYKNVRTLLGEVRSVDVDTRTVTLDQGSLAYDHLIVATGAGHSYFGHDDWAAHAPGLKSLDDATAIRRKVLLAYEAAEREQDPAVRRALLTFVVVGAGPTGVELAGALAEIGHHAMAGEFRAFAPEDVRVLLLEGADRVLPPFEPASSAAAAQQLAKLNVEVRTGARVTHIDAEGVMLGDERIAARTVLWAAGVQGSRLGAALGGPTDRAGRVEVDAQLRLPGHPEVFVVGDLAAASSEGKAVPGVAQGAIQGGQFAAAVIQAELQGRTLAPFRYVDKGSMATIGRRAAVAEIGGRRLRGTLAWLAWMVVHIAFLIGFRNRVLVLLSWAWAWLTFRRGARLITGGFVPLPAPGDVAAPPQDGAGGNTRGPQRVEASRPAA